jgi:DNA polymerase V
MQDANLMDGDILVVDRSLTASSGTIAVCLLDGDFTVKRVVISATAVTLVPENPKFKPLVVQPDQDFTVWGVVTWILHRSEGR